MSRIFTMKFLFNQAYYDAIISIIVKDEKMQFTIKVMDAGLHQLIPDGHVSYEGANGFKELAIMQDQLSKNLMHTIATSIENHLLSKA